MPVSFEMWLSWPDRRKERVGPLGGFRTDPSGAPASCGQMEFPAMKGTYRLEAVIGTTVVGSATISVQ